MSALTRTASGLLAYFNSGNPADPQFDTADWDAYSNLTISIDGSGRLAVAEAAHSDGLLTLNSLSPRSKAFVQARFTDPSTGATEGVVVAAVPGSDDTLQGIRFDIPLGFSGTAKLAEFDGATTTILDSKSANYSHASQRVAVFHDGSTAAGWIEADNYTPSGTAPTTIWPGYVGLRFGAGGATTFAVSSFYAFTDRYVNITGIPVGDTVNIVSGAGFTLASASVVAGAAQVDLLATEAQLATHIDIVSGGSTVDSITPTTAVWPGDTYAYLSLPDTPSISVSNIMTTDALLSGSVYSDPDSDPHVSSQWQIDANGGDFSSPVFDSGTDTTNLLSIAASGLSPNTLYDARVRYTDDTGATSAYSSVATFRTLALGVSRLNLFQRRGVPTQSASAKFPVPPKQFDPANEAAFRRQLTGVMDGLARAGETAASNAINATFGASEDDFAITSVATMVVTTDTGGSTLTGLAGGSPGQQLQLVNAGPGSLTLADQDAGSAIKNRLKTLSGTDLTLSVGGALVLFYDGAALRWRPVGVNYYRASATWDPGSVADAASTTTTVAVSGATSGDLVLVGFSNSLAGLLLVGYVSAADTVTVVLANLTGSAVDLASGTLHVQVWPK